MFSRYYIIFYLAMTGLSLGTVVLSLMEGESRASGSLEVREVGAEPLDVSLVATLVHGDSGGCPSTTWHILEVIVNAGMVLEVGTRWIGFGKVRREAKSSSTSHRFD